MNTSPASLEFAYTYIAYIHTKTRVEKKKNYSHLSPCLINSLMSSQCPHTPQKRCCYGNNLLRIYGLISYAWLGYSINCYRLNINIIASFQYNAAPSAQLGYCTVYIENSIRCLIWDLLKLKKKNIISYTAQ